MGKPLYEIQQEYQQLLNDIEAAEGDISPEQELQLAISQTDLATKSLNYVKMIATLEAEAAFGEAEIKRAQAYVKQKRELADRLRANLLVAVQAFGPIQAGTHRITVRQAEAVAIDEEERIPERYLVRKVTSVPDKAKIKAALKDGLFVEGAYLKHNPYLHIK